MAKGTVRLKGSDLRANYETSMYSMAKYGDVSYNAVRKYLNKPQQVSRMSGTMLYAILMNLGLTKEEVLDLRLGDVFDLVDFEATTE